ncbi:MAG: hypothetical protein ABMA64_40425 [Myxococcota bacterium]
MVLWFSSNLARADEIPYEQWPAIAAACLHAYPDRVTLPVSARDLESCRHGESPGRCDGSNLVSPSVAACIGNTLAYPPEGPARVQVFGPVFEDAPVLVYRIVRPLVGKTIRESGWYVDAHDGRVLGDWTGPQLNRHEFTGQDRGLPYD